MAFPCMGEGRVTASFPKVFGYSRTVIISRFLFLLGCPFLGPLIREISPCFVFFGLCLLTFPVADFFSWEI